VDCNVLYCVVYCASIECPWLAMVDSGKGELLVLWRNGVTVFALYCAVPSCAVRLWNVAVRFTVLKVRCTV
jgi:hypothetical protein